MRAVTGSVIDSKPISLSKASVVLSRFATGRSAACPEVAAYVRRASTAFDRLVRFHREIRAARKISELEEPFAQEEELGMKAKRKKRSGDEPKVSDAGDWNPHGGRKTKERKKAVEE